MNARMGSTSSLAPAVKLDTGAMAGDEPTFPRRVPRPAGGGRAEGLRSRTPWLVGGAAVLGSGLALDWSGLTTVGTAPVILSLAPCALMCTLGLCRGKGGGGS